MMEEGRKVAMLWEKYGIFNPDLHNRVDFTGSSYAMRN